MSKDIILVNKIRYLVHGKKAPSNSRFKGTINLNSLTGLLNYTGKEEKKNETQSLLSYSAKIEGHSTLTNLGYIDSEEKAIQFREEIAEYFNEDGRICWDTIASIPSYEVAKEHGLNTPSEYTNLVERGLIKFFVNIGLNPSNMIYWIDHHNDTDNPHCHFGFMEKRPTIKKGFFSNQKLEQLKRYLANELLKRKEIVNQNILNLLKEKDNKKIEVRDTAKELVKEAEGKIGDAIKLLYGKLSDEGRLSYNSTHMKEHREELDKIVEMILTSNDEIKEKHNSFRETLLKLDNNSNQSINSNQYTLFEKEEEKLKIQIANYILKEFKDYGDLHPEKPKTVTLDIIPTTITKDEDITKGIIYPDTNIKIYFDDTDVVNVTDPLKDFKIVNNKKYRYIDENGIGKVATGNDIFKNIQTQLYNQAMILKNEDTQIIHNNQITILKDKVQIKLYKEKTSFQVEKTNILPVNHLFSLVKIAEPALLVYTNKFCYLSKEMVQQKINKNTDCKIEVVNANPKVKKIIPKHTAKKIGRKSRSLGMSWMNKVEQETEQALQAFLNNHEK